MTAGCFVLQPLRWWPRYTLWLWAPVPWRWRCRARRWLPRRAAPRPDLGLALLALVSLSEGALAVAHAKEAQRAVGRWLGAAPANRASLGDPHHALNAASWVDPVSGRSAWTARPTCAAVRGSRAPITPISTGSSRNCNRARACM